MLPPRTSFSWLPALAILALGCGDSGSSSAGGGGGGDGTGGHAHDACTAPTDCPAPESPCVEATCDAGKCGTRNIEAGVAATGDVAGDCQKSVCDGSGALTTEADASDLPVDDGNACTVEQCNGSAPSSTPASEGASCSGSDGAKVCDGAGVCVECNSTADCVGDDVCDASSCVPGSCVNGTLDGLETDIDCGGTECNSCGLGETCAVDDDCASTYCDESVLQCATPACDDVVKNGDETDVDCGGACEPCGNGSGCLVDGDCSSGYCDPSLSCAEPACDDGAKNADETDVDCGGSCGPCADGDSCTLDSECTSGHCVEGVCGALNGCTRATATDRTASATLSISFGSYFYDPPCVVVKKGTQVTFDGSFMTHPLIGGYIANNMSFPANDGPFTTMVNTGSSASFQLDTTGVYPYYCVFHPTLMYGTIYVEP
jgi:plastocyanin